jgi:acyl carrier protein
VSVGFDARRAVRDAVALVCEVDAGSLTDASRFADLGADSLARVSIADLVEASAVAGGARTLRIDDHLLCRMTSLGDLADYAARNVGPAGVARVAS